MWRKHDHQFVGLWEIERIERCRTMWYFLTLLLISFSCQRLGACDSFDSEARALLSFRDGVKLDPFGALSNWGERGVDYCFWFGVECSDDGRAVSLNLEDLCLEGKLTSEVANLNHLKSLILHNNSFSGNIPIEISKLQKLEVLDLGDNNFSGPFPYALLEIVSLKVVVLRDNWFLNDISPEFFYRNVISNLQTNEEMSDSEKRSDKRNIEYSSTRRSILQVSERRVKPHKHRRHPPIKGIRPAPSPLPMSSPLPPPVSSPLPSPMSSPSLSASPSPSEHQSPLLSPSPNSLSPADQSYNESPYHANYVPPPSPGNDASYQPVYITIGAGIFTLFSLSSVYFICCRPSKVETEPIKTGLSQKLQKALVMGVPSLKRSELQTACEDFSNVIDSLSDCMLYKGTLSSGVEIAVTSTLIKTSEEWSGQAEAMFRNKISVLSTVNHKNFMNLIGYCEEEEPFARMMVYEYAPNGTLFEHLHIKEAEPLDWIARLRVAMGIAYCLDHLLRINPPVHLRVLNSSIIYLTDDYAAKISDLSFWKEDDSNSTPQTADELEPESGSPLSSQEIVYKFGIVLLELISGRLPFSKDDGLLVLWASSHLTGKRPLSGIVDQTVEPLTDEDIIPLCKLVQSCVNPLPSERPSMGDVVAQLRKITEISPEAATPKLSPLWWAELEIIS